MESEPTAEKVAHIDLNTYLEITSSLDQISGELPSTELEGFYLWHKNAYPDFKVQGFSMLDTYRHNVLEGGMSEERFEKWCRDFELPHPDLFLIPANPGLFIEYLEWYRLETDRRNNIYEQWAEEKGIDTRPGAVMKFLDSEGNVYRVRTEFDRRGEVIIDPQT